MTFKYLFSVSSLRILSESVQGDKGQATQNAVLKRLYAVLSKGLNDRVTNLSIKLQHCKEVVRKLYRLICCSISLLLLVACN